MMKRTHHNSVVDAPRANDKASGVRLMHELARVYGAYIPIKKIRFIAFSKEEGGNQRE